MDPIDEQVEKEPVLDEKTQKSRIRCFLLTHWNVDIVAKQIEAIKTQIVYVAWQFEHCPDTGAAHAHILIIYKNAKKYKEVHAHFPNPKKSSWVFPARDMETCIRYCTTDPFITSKGVLKAKGRYEGPWEIGVRPKGQGFRTDWVPKRELCRKRKRDVLEEDPEIIFKYEKAYNSIQNLQSSEKTALLKAKVIQLPCPPDIESACTFLEDTLKIERYNYYIIDKYTALRLKPWEGYEHQENLLVQKDCIGVIPKVRIPLDVHYNHTYPDWHTVYVF